MMNKHRTVAAIAVLSFMSAAACDQESATPPPVVAADPAPAADNTASNKTDGAADVKTPLDQSEAVAHIKITADIRKAIMDDKTMSMNAQNCKIITDKSGMVTLRGVVENQAEKDSIEAKAQAIAGAAMVDNQLEIKVS